MTLGRADRAGREPPATSAPGRVGQRAAVAARAAAALNRALVVQTTAGMN
ncbi:hypothetical protein WME79_26945 [Sorangium sp. So ce726]